MFHSLSQARHCFHKGSPILFFPIGEQQNVSKAKFTASLEVLNLSAQCPSSWAAGGQDAAKQLTRVPTGSGFYLSSSPLIPFKLLPSRQLDRSIPMQAKQWSVWCQLTGSPPVLCPVAEVACSACGGPPRPPSLQLVALCPQFTGLAYLVLELRICQMPCKHTSAQPLVNARVAGCQSGAASRLQHWRRPTAADTDRHTCSFTRVIHCCAISAP